MLHDSGGRLLFKSSFCLSCFTTTATRFLAATALTWPNSRRLSCFYLSVSSHGKFSTLQMRLCCGVSRSSGVNRQSVCMLGWSRTDRKCMIWLCLIVLWFIILSLGLVIRLWLNWNDTDPSWSYSSMLLLGVFIGQYAKLSEEIVKVDSRNLI